MAVIVMVIVMVDLGEGSRMKNSYTPILRREKEF